MVPKNSESSYKGLFQSLYTSLDPNRANLSTSQVPPHKLIELFETYSDWMANNPLKEPVLIQKTGEIVEVPRPRAMTAKSFCLFAGINYHSFLAMEKSSTHKHICAAIRDCIFSQKFEHAAVNMMNPNFIAKDLGLVEQISVSNSETAKGISDLFPEERDIIDVEIVETKELPYGDK